MDDDFNTAQAIGHLFNLLKKINSIFTGQLKASAALGEACFCKPEKHLYHLSWKTF
jgi:cysteinyl-tRNA synthetase